MTSNECEVFDQGSGPTLVLLHGVGGSWKIWTPVLNALTPHFRVVAPTLPGHPGGVPLVAAEGAPSIDHIADALLVQLQGMGLKSAHLVGNSMGGWLAVELARRGFAASVLALSPAGAWKEASDYKDLTKRLLLSFYLIPLIYLLMRLFLWIPFIRRVLGRDTMVHGDRVSSVELAAIMRQFGGTSMMPALFENVGHKGQIKPYHDPTVPVTIAWSEHDRVIPFDRYGEPFHARVTGATSDVIHDAGHVPMYDNSVEVVRAIFRTTMKAPSQRGIA